MRPWFAIVVVAFAGLCFAPIEDKPDGVQFHGELSDAQLEQLQGDGNVASTAPGQGYQSHSDDAGRMNSASEAEAAKSLSLSANSDSNAVKSLQGADADLKPVKKEPGKFLMFAFLFIVAGMAVAYGFRAYMDKIVPERPKRKKITF
ncbi:MAG: hypothetical protein R2688_03300 [Fimbriimonadaceae bacterium]